MKKLLILIILLIQVPTYAILVDVDGASAGAYGTKANGYYVDGRQQVPEYSRIAPPHEENIPDPHPTKTVQPWDRYYEINKQGYRPMGYQAPLVPNYNYFYSTRRAKPYTRNEYLSVWCEGVADYDKGTCSTDNKVYYYYDVYHWSTAIAATQFETIHKTADPLSFSEVSAPPSLFLPVLLVSSPLLSGRASIVTLSSLAPQTVQDLYLLPVTPISASFSTTHSPPMCSMVLTSLSV